MRGHYNLVKPDKVYVFKEISLQEKEELMFQRARRESIIIRDPSSSVRVSVNDLKFASYLDLEDEK